MSARPLRIPLAESVVLTDQPREASISLERLAAADEILLTSSVRGVHPATVRGGEPRFQTGARVRTALEPQAAEVVAR